MKQPGWIAYAGILAVLSSTLVASHLTPNRNPEPLLAPLRSIRADTAGWKLKIADERSLNLDSASSYLAGTYLKGSYEVGLLIVHHDSHQGLINVHTPQNCLPGSGWEIWKADVASVVFDGHPTVVNQYHISNLNERKAVLYWYQSRNRVTPSEFTAKLMLIRDALLERRSSGSFVRIAMSDEPEAIREGLQFAEVVMKELRSCFRP